MMVGTCIHRLPLNLVDAHEIDFQVADAFIFSTDKNIKKGEGGRVSGFLIFAERQVKAVNGLQLLAGVLTKKR